MADLREEGGPFFELESLISLAAPPRGGAPRAPPPASHRAAMQAEGEEALAGLEAEATAFIRRIVAACTGGGGGNGVPDAADLHALARLFEREDER